MSQGELLVSAHFVRKRRQNSVHIVERSSQSILKRPLISRGTKGKELRCLLGTRTLIQSQANLRHLIGLLYHCFYKHADSTTLLQLYKSFVCPHFEYCSIVWNPYLAGDIEALERVQRFALRVYLKNWTADHDQLYNQSNITPLRRSHASLCHLFKMVNDLIDYPESPLQFREIYHNSRHSHALQLRDIMIKSRTNQFLNFFLPGTIALWNSLLHSVLSSPSISLKF